MALKGPPINKEKDNWRKFPPSEWPFYYNYLANLPPLVYGDDKTKHMQKTASYFFLCLLLAGCQPNTTPSPLPVAPNIILLLADDLGYSDLGCYGGLAATPNLDRLAREGVRFTDFYAAAPNCSPSRAGLLTGRAPTRVGVYNYIPAGHPMHLREEEVTLAELLKEKAYRTAQFGKWHLSSLPPYEKLGQPQPHDQGFDYSLGTTNNAQPSHLNPVNFVRNGEEVGEMKGYSCDIVVNETIHWLEEQSDSAQPFFCYLAFHEPHKKVASPPQRIAHYPDQPPKVAEYLANVENMDAAIGRLLDYLATAELEEETLILFSSDNGSYRNGSNAPLLGGKSFVYEGGIRVPGIIRWKGQISPGQTIAQPVGLVDVMPTISELAAQAHPKPESLDGVSWVPLLQGQDFQREKPLSWFFYRTTPEMAMRFGDYVMLGRTRDTTLHTHPMSAPDMDHIKNIRLKDFEVYKLSEDIGQENNIPWQSLDLGPQFQQQLLERFASLQAEAPVWDSLPPPNRMMKPKSAWRKLRPTGFSN